MKIVQRISLIIRTDRSKRFIKYCIVGAIGFTVQTLVSKILITLSIPPGPSVSIGAEAAIMSNFTWNNLWTFKHHKISGILRVMRKFLQFNSVAIGAIILEGVTVQIGTNIFGVSTWFFFMVFSIVFLVIPYSFFMYNRFIWKTHLR